MIKRKSSKSKKHQRFDTDLLFQSIGQKLIQDFRKLPGVHSRFEDQVNWFKDGISAVHNAQWPSYKEADYINFKCWYQLEHLCKRYVSPSDKMTPEERELLTIRKFLAVQEKACNPPPVTYRSFLVVQEARRIIKNILGPFSMDELLSNVAFGTRANTGVPYSRSYLDVKYSCMTGSQDHVDWFLQTFLPQDEILHQDYASEYLGRAELAPTVESIDSLDLVCVPKKHNSDRTVMPNSVLGTFYTNALMVMIDRRLSEYGYNIRTLQKRHGALAKFGSRTGKLATGDLSSASDLPGFALMCKLIPREWLNALRFGRISNFRYKDDSYKLTSFMAMGVNYTFPLETLIFLSLLLAIRQLSKIKGTVSVYGDDLIYPIAMAPMVRDIFEDIGLKFNEEKSFSTGHFRESCGQDFIYGRPVRPFQPEVTGGMVPKFEYLALLYKCFNGLCHRWKPKEIPTVLHFLYLEILRIGYVNLVPHDFPDTAGVKTEFARAIHFDWWIPTTPIWWCPIRQQFGFSYLTQKRERRIIPNMFPYYWNALRLSHKDSTEKLFYKEFLNLSDVTEITWKKSKKKRVRTRSGFEPELIPTVPDKSKGVTYTRNEGFTSMWA